MSILPRLSIATKLYAIFALLAIATVALAAVAVVNARHHNALTQEFEAASQGAKHVERLNGLIYAVAMESRGIYMSADANAASTFVENSSPIAVVDAGKTLGEMSMIDGEARFATCASLEPTVLAVLDRENLARIIVEQPMLGAKILMQMILMLSQRLRTTSGRLLQLMYEKSRRATLP